MKILYYDCFAGISGDMNLGALIDLGVDEEYLKKELARLNLEEFDLRTENKVKSGISGKKVTVVLKKLKRRYHSHNHRTYSDIKELIENSDLKRSVKDLSIKIFTLLGKAESKIHGVPLEKVHFHEVGATDSIVDIVGAAICLDFLKPGKIMASTIELGGGFVSCEHGVFPVPAPATIEILKGIPVKSGIVQDETTTPTGAAILAACVDEFTDFNRYKIKKIGYGLGEKDFEIPNVLRVYLAEQNTETDSSKSGSVLTECNIDDMNPEFYDHIFDLLLKTGANDVFITPIIMKKSRPAVKLSVLSENQLADTVEKILLTETSTLGVRKYMVEKTMLKRKVEKIKTPYGTVHVKSAFYNGEFLRSKPEYEDCLKIARERNISLNEVYRIVNELLNSKKLKV